MRDLAAVDAATGGASATAEHSDRDEGDEDDEVLIDRLTSEEIPPNEE